MNNKDEKYYINYILKKLIKSWGELHYMFDESVCFDLFKEKYKDILNKPKDVVIKSLDEFLVIMTRGSEKLSNRDKNHLDYTKLNFEFNKDYLFVLKKYLNDFNNKKLLYMLNQISNISFDYKRLFDYCNLTIYLNYIFPVMKNLTTLCNHDEKEFKNHLDQLLAFIHNVKKLMSNIEEKNYTSFDLDFGQTYYRFLTIYYEKFTTAKEVKSAIIKEFNKCIAYKTNINRSIRNLLNIHAMYNYVAFNIKSEEKEVDKKFYTLSIEEQNKTLESISHNNISKNMPPLINYVNLYSETFRYTFNDMKI